MHSILLAWIGRTDLRAPLEEAEVGLGPIAQAIKARNFDELVLLKNASEEETHRFLEWLKKRWSGKLTVLEEPLSRPTHFQEIFEAACRACEQVLQASPHRRPLLTFHLSPGTPAMASVWVLLAKTRYPAELIESSREAGVQTVNLPFEISLDFIPELLRDQDERLRRSMAEPPPAAPGFEDILHRSKSMARLISRAQRVALHSIPVLIEGESGTGKELLARAIHNASPRRAGPFVAVNCGAIPLELIESELFGHERGAFTGASQQRMGYFESAHKGTLMLDEVGELPLRVQVKLLRVLQEGEVVRVGATNPLKVDVRIIAATHRILTEEIADGRFREDLFFRLAVAILKVPPLCDREGDLSLLIDRLLGQVNEEASGEPGIKHKKISAGARNILMNHTWPGNVRELLNTLRRAAVWSDGSTITIEDAKDALIPFTGRQGSNLLERPFEEGFSLPDLLDEVAGHYLRRAMTECDGNKTKAAKTLGLPSYQTLSNWLEKYGVS